MPHRRERQRFPFVSLAVCVQHVLARSISISSGRDCMRVCSCVYATNNMRRCIDSILWQICKKKAQKSMCKAHKCEINRIRCSSRSGKGFKDSTTHTHTQKHTSVCRCGNNYTKRLPSKNELSRKSLWLRAYAYALQSVAYISAQIESCLPTKLKKLLPTFARSILFALASHSAKVLPTFARRSI